jgi:hypothetical protein
MLSYDQRLKVAIVVSVCVLVCGEYMRQLELQEDLLNVQTFLIWSRRRQAARTRKAAMMACFDPDGLGRGLPNQRDLVVQRLEWCAPNR